MSNKRKLKNSVAFSAVSALMISGVAVAPGSAAVIDVTNCLDSGAGSLRDAVTNANFQDFISLEDLDCNLITLNEEIAIETSLTIVGPGASELSISNNSTNNNGLFGIGNSVNFVNFSRMTLTTHSVDALMSSPLVYSEGSSSVAFNAMEVTGVQSESYPLSFNGPVRIGESSFHGNRNVRTALLYGPSFYIANSTFIGNSTYEGTLFVAGRVALINSAFVDNFPIDYESQGNSVVFGVSELSAYSSIFAEDFLTNEGQMFYPENTFTDQGSNYFAFDAALTDVHGVTNTTVGNGASTLVSREDLKLGTFGRVLNPDNDLLSPNHQQLDVGSVAIDSHTLEQFEVANNALTLEFSGSLVPEADGSGGLRRPYGPKYDSGPIEYRPATSGEPAKRSKNVLFNPMSSTLTKEARRTLRNMVNNLPEGATVRRINVTGFVQPAGFSWNNKSLSEARAKSVKRFLKTLGVKGQWKIAARGEGKDSTSKARRVKVVVKFDIAPS